MKIRRFVAKDMRTALEQIKVELGADAVIMSNKKIPEGVELMAAVDYSQQVPAPSQELSESTVDANGRSMESDVVSLSGQNIPSQSNQSQQIPNSGPSASDIADAASSQDSLVAFMQRHGKHQQGRQTSVASKPTPAKAEGLAQGDIDLEQQLKSFTDRLEQGAHQQQTSTAEMQTEQVSPTESTSPVNNPQPIHQAQTMESPSAANNVADIEKMRAEMASIRQLLEHQVSGLMWQDMAQKDPSKALMVNKLMGLGLAEQVADQIASYLPVQHNEQEAWEQAKQLLVSQLNTTNNEIIHRGGVVSLVGPTGVGKTTTIAKLAARFAQIHGADQVVLISTDSYRIAGFEQLSTYGRIIGCQVKLAKDAKSLDTLLQQFSQKKLVLIDTAGMGQRDMRLTEQLTQLIGNARVRIRNYLVLAANTQQIVMQENVERFKKVPLAGCIFTKLDESLSVGEIISTAIQNGLPIGYLTDGQRVPEDIKVANAEKLVTLADRLAAKINRQDIRRSIPTNYAVGM